MMYESLSHLVNHFVDKAGIFMENYVNVMTAFELVHASLDYFE